MRMQNTQPVAATLARPSVRWTALAAAVALATLAPLLQSQPVTGTIVNALLITVAVLFGFRSAVLVAAIPGPIALAAGLLPAVLASAVPFIIAGNIVFVWIFLRWHHVNYWRAVLYASVAKSVVLTIAAFIIARVVSSGIGGIARSALVMMTWPQLYTALAGGVLAYAVIRFSKIQQA